MVIVSSKNKEQSQKTGWEYYSGEDIPRHHDLDTVNWPVYYLLKINDDQFLLTFSSRRQTGSYIKIEIATPFLLEEIKGGKRLESGMFPDQKKSYPHNVTSFPYEDKYFHGVLGLVAEFKLYL